MSWILRYFGHNQHQLPGYVGMNGMVPEKMNRGTSMEITQDMKEILSMKVRKAMELARWQVS